MSDLSSDGYDFDSPKPVVMITKPPRFSESSDEEVELDCVKDTSDEEPFKVGHKTRIKNSTPTELEELQV